MSTLKERKEQFVTGLTGGSTLEIYTVTLISVVSYVVYLFFHRRLKDDVNNAGALKLLDFLLNWVLFLLSVTTYASLTGELIAFVAIPVVSVLVYEVVSASVSSKAKKSAPQRAKAKKVTLELDASNLIVHKPFLTVYRSQMMVATMVAILAVDFPVFPRRFAKVETWGTSLMDLGVGSFVFSLGLFSSKSLILNRYNNTKFKFIGMLFKSIKHSIPLLVLGFIRLISVKIVGYQEHVTEYGYHWNFFFTLGFLPIFVNLLLPLTSVIPHLVLAVVIALVYEIVLMKTDLLKFILVAPRTDLISANREGIFSFIGYLSIFLSGQGCGFFLLPGLKGPKNLWKPSTRAELVKSIEKPTKSLFSVSPLSGLIVLASFYHITYYVIDTCYSYHVSRRLANLLYVLWVCAYNTTYIALFYMGAKLFSREVAIEYTAENGQSSNGKDRIIEEYMSVTPYTLEAVNRNGLVLFLISNLLTGAVNMSFNTLDATNNVAIAILIAYCALIVVVASALYELKIFIKL